MQPNCFETPILFTAYNRPRHSKVVFERIREIRPRQLFMAADGPSSKRNGDAEKCREVQALADAVDWPCEVRTLFRETNVGCRRAMHENISWFFSQVDEGIILEDDCLPHISFFRFCRELLEKYRNDARIMLICGDNKRLKVPKNGDSYYFSRLVHIWGWATWKRAWTHFDVNIRTFPEFKKEGLIRNIFPNPAFQRFWTENFQNVYNGTVDTWDYQWAYTVLSQGGLSIMPSVNLVCNIGFDREATHTTCANQNASLETEEIGTIVHPKFVVPNNRADELVAGRFYGVELNGSSKGIAALLKRFRLFV